MKRVSVVVLAWASLLVAGPPATALTLEEAIRTAWAHNGQVQAARFDVAAKGGEVLREWAGYLPSAQASFGRGDDPDTAFDRPQDHVIYSYRWQVAARQPLYTFGYLEGKHRKAKWLQQAARAEVDVKINEVVFDVTKAFNTVMLNRDAGALYEQNVENSREHLEQVKALLVGGKAIEADVRDAEVRLHADQNELLSARADLDQAKRQLNLLMGAPLDAPVEIVEEFTAPNVVVEPSAVEVNNPELLKLDREARAARDGERSAVGAMLPFLYLEGQYGYTYLQDKDPNRGLLVPGAPAPGLSVEGPVARVSLVLELSVFQRLFEGIGNRRNAVAVQKRLQAAQLYREQAILVAIQGAWADMARASRAIAVARQRLEAAELRRASVEALVAAGRATPVDLSDARRAASLARRDVLYGIFELRVAIALLQKETGAALRARGIRMQDLE